MQLKQLVEKVYNLRLCAIANEFVGPETIDLVSGKPQFPIGGHHTGVHPQRGLVVFREVVFSVHFDDDALAARQEQQKVHALPRERQTVA